MNDKTNAVESQRVALPAYLPKRMQAFRIGKGGRQSYVVRDKLQDKTYDFEPWQFFVLEVLPGCEDIGKLLTVFSERFGYPLPPPELSRLLGSVADAKLFAEDASNHPVLAPYFKKTYVVENGEAKLRSFAPAVSGIPPRASDGPPAAPAGALKNPKGKVQGTPDALRRPGVDEVLPPGIQDAIGFDPRASRRVWLAVDPRPLLKLSAPLLKPLKYGIYLLPLLAVAGVSLTVSYGSLIRQDIERILRDMSFIGLAPLSLVTVNLLVTVTTAVLAFRFRATVSGIGVSLFMGFLPRFTMRIGYVDQLSRVERLWLHAAPLLVRLAAYGVCLITWHSTRHANGVLAKFALAVAVTCAVGLAIAANPLIKSSGYQLLAVFTNESHLRDRAYKTLVNKLKGSTFKEADGLLLATYAVASLAFVFAMVVAALVLLGGALREVQLGGTALILIAVVGLVLLRRMHQYFSRVETNYERALQFERWRTRKLAPEATQESLNTNRTGIYAYVWNAVPLCLLVVAFIPYPYSPGGNFTIFPAMQQVISTDVAGVVKEVYFDGGETLKKGTVVARLADADNQAMVNIYAARIREQQAVIDDLKSRPRPEDVAVAERALNVEETRAEFSGAKVFRLGKLYRKGAISFEEMDEARRDNLVDLEQVQEKRAALEAAKLGATPDELASAQAKLEGLKAEHDSYLDKVRRSVLVMPFDGKLLTLHLKQKGNSYYNRGDAFAGAEYTGEVTAELEVPETDVEYIVRGATVRAKPVAFSDTTFIGEVRTIDWNVTEQPFGNVVKVVAKFDNADGRLRNGMKGYAKVSGPTLPVWKAFSMAVLRFVRVQVWSWIP